MQDYAQAHAFLTTITGNADSVVVDFRLLHDTNKGAEGISLRGTLPQCWQIILHYQAQGYGAFVVISEMDGAGNKLANVRAIRAHYIDLDNISAPANYQRAASWVPAPTIAVQSSPGKFHVYWCVQPYLAGNDWFMLHQRKLKQFFDGDDIIDATRVMRLPGTLHLKQPHAPHLVTCWSLPGYGARLDPSTLAQALAHINIYDSAGSRFPLGHADLQAPSREWLEYALQLADPNDMDRYAWMGFSAAIKQAGWSHYEPSVLRDMWLRWCARYEHNDEAENIKLWDSFRDSEVGWKSILRRVPSLNASYNLGLPQQRAVPQLPAQEPAIAPSSPAVPSLPPANDLKGDILNDIEQQQYFRNVVYVVNLGAMMTDENRFLNSSQFNAKYGGKLFIINAEGKLTDEPWRAATRSTLWTVPKVDHIRFLPTKSHMERISDDMGRIGVNVYKPYAPRRVQGDPSPFLWHVSQLLPNSEDQRILYSYLAHNAKYPGYKIPWAPVIQSVQGAGKGSLKRVLSHVMGQHYVYYPNARELSGGGSKFNAWMRNKLFILADEIMVDDKRDLIEVLKPLISEVVVEVQGKGVDQDIEDNFANWGFFTNHKSAVPVGPDDRRFALFFSPLQTKADLMARGMGDQYFTSFYNWLDADGSAIVANWLLDYPIERGSIAMRAPDTSSLPEALAISRGPVERMIIEAIEDEISGFRGGWISNISVIRRMREVGIRSMTPTTIDRIINGMGYVDMGRAPRAFAQERVDGKDMGRPHLFHVTGRADVAEFGRAQGWE